MSLVKRPEILWGKTSPEGKVLRCGQALLSFHIIRPHVKESVATIYLACLCHHSETGSLGNLWYVRMLSRYHDWKLKRFLHAASVFWLPIQAFTFLVRSGNERLVECPLCETATLLLLALLHHAPASDHQNPYQQALQQLQVGTSAALEPPGWLRCWTTCTTVSIKKVTTHLIRYALLAAPICAQLCPRWTFPT